MLKRVITAALTVSIMASVFLTPAVAASAFSDVSSDKWYAADVASVQQYGIINGTGGGKFNPGGNLTLAEAITMAARTYAHINCETIPTGGDTVWYTPYLRYAEEKGICSMGEFGANYNDNCNRLTMAKLFERVIPAGTDNAINQVESLPDVQNSSSNAAVFHLYQLGIMVGSDKYGTFHPYQSITRAETAAILRRVLDPVSRKTVKLESVPSIVDIYTAAAEQAVDFFFSDENEMMYSYILSDYFDGGDLGCDFYDIDGNGTPEMLLGFSNLPGEIYAIYTIHDYHAVCLGTGWVAQRGGQYYTLCSDGRVARQSYGPGHGGFDFYQFPINGTKLNVTDSFICIYGDVGHEYSYWYSNQFDWDYYYSYMWSHPDDFDMSTIYKKISEGYFNSAYDEFCNNVKYCPTFD